MRRFAYATRIPYGSLGKYFCHTCRKWFLFFFFGINKRRTQTKQTKETASLTNDHKQWEGERDRESEQREQAPLHLMSYRGRERAFAHAHTHTVRAKIFCIEYSAQRKTIENHLSNILYCLLQPFSIDRIQLFILGARDCKGNDRFRFRAKNWKLSHWFLHICIIIIIYISLCLFIYMFFYFLKTTNYIDSVRLGQRRETTTETGHARLHNDLSRV